MTNRTAETASHLYEHQKESKKIWDPQTFTNSDYSKHIPKYIRTTLKLSNKICFSLNAHMTIPGSRSG